MYENDIYSSSGIENNSQYNGGQNNYNTYRTLDSASMNQNDWNNSGNNKGHKTGGFLKKALLSTSLGLFFGIFAGAGFYAVQQGMESVNKEAAISQTVIEGESKAEEKLPENKTLDNDYTASGINYIYYTDSDIADVVEDVMPAMVSIVNNYTETVNFFGQTYSENGTASGSGIIVADNDEEILIVTNNHVVDGADSLHVTFIDNEEAAAVVKGTDSEMDLAVIAVKTKDLSSETRAAITAATLGDSDELRLGEPVIAIGNALGYGQSVTNGIVSALDREVTLEDGSVRMFIQTNAAINHGNSGGALLNIKGEVIGINSNKIDGESVEGMGYAIPITSASPIIAELMERQTREKVAESEMGYIGINIQEVTSQIAEKFNMPEGIYVVNLIEGGGAERAGMLVGDIITKFDGQKISSYSELQRTLQYYSVGETVKITVMRAENGVYVPHELELTLGARPAANK